MSIVVAGTVALDDVKTPYGTAKEILGGSATYFSLSASYFSKVGLIAVVGEDFPERYKEIFSKHGVSTEGLIQETGKTFRWSGEYRNNWNEAHTLKTDLNVLESFNPKVPSSYRHENYLFLANIDPDIQKSVLHQMNHPKAIFCDSMNFWIQNKRKNLCQLIKHVRGIFLNESEAKDLSKEQNILKSALKIQQMGPKIVCIKKGDEGAVLLNGKSIFFCPIYPWTRVKDPTGAGDSFAGGFLGYLSRCRRINDKNLRIATIYGSVMASFAVEDFSIKRLVNLRQGDIEDRFVKLRQATKF